MTAAQLERKRELDREAQKSIRLKTKNHIAHLEALVQSLQKSEGSNDRISELVAQVQASHEEINKLREAMRTIAKTANLMADNPCQTERGVSKVDQDDVGESEKDISNLGITAMAQPIHKGSRERTSADASAPYSLAAASPPTLNEIVEPDLESNDILGAIGHLELQNTHPNLPVGPDDTSPTEAVDVGGAVEHTINSIVSQVTVNKFAEGKLWYLAGSILSCILNHPEWPRTPADFSEDIPVRAVLNGWKDTLKHYGGLDAGWQWLRVLDETIYFALGIPSRLAIMRVMRLQFEAQLVPHKKEELPLPGFMAARPAQQYLDHEPLVEHFVWPGFREHILFAPRKYVTNSFMETFRSECHFAWPFNPEQAFHRNPMTGLYAFSKDFLARQNDLRSWCMRSDFFERFPELRQDFPCFEDNPMVSARLLFPPDLSGTNGAGRGGSPESFRDHDVNTVVTMSSAGHQHLDDLFSSISTHWPPELL